MTKRQWLFDYIQWVELPGQMHLVFGNHTLTAALWHTVFLIR